MKKTIALAISICLFIACTQEQNNGSVPENILSKEKMAQVITSLHIAEAELILRTFPDLPAGQAGSSANSKINFQKIFETHQITQEQYETSLSFYIEHPEMLNEIYQQVLNELSRKQGKARSQ